MKVVIISSQKWHNLKMNLLGMIDDIIHDEERDQLYRSCSEQEKLETIEGFVLNFIRQVEEISL